MLRDEAAKSILQRMTDAALDGCDAPSVAIAHAHGALLTCIQYFDAADTVLKALQSALPNHLKRCGQILTQPESASWQDALVALEILVTSRRVRWSDTQTVCNLFSALQLTMQHRMRDSPTSTHDWTKPYENGHRLLTLVDMCVQQFVAPRQLDAAEADDALLGVLLKLYHTTLECCAQCGTEAAVFESIFDHLSFLLLKLTRSDKTADLVEAVAQMLPDFMETSWPAFSTAPELELRWLTLWAQLLTTTTAIGSDLPSIDQLLRISIDNMQHGVCGPTIRMVECLALFLVLKFRLHDSGATGSQHCSPASPIYAAFVQWLTVSCRALARTDFGPAIVAEATVARTIPVLLQLAQFATQYGLAVHEMAEFASTLVTHPVWGRMLSEHPSALAGYTADDLRCVEHLSWVRMMLELSRMSCQWPEEHEIQHAVAAMNANTVNRLLSLLKRSSWSFATFEELDALFQITIATLSNPIAWRRRCTLQDPHGTALWHGIEAFVAKSIRLLGCSTQPTLLVQRGSPERASGSMRDNAAEWRERYRWTFTAVTRPEQDRLKQAGESVEESVLRPLHLRAVALGLTTLRRAVPFLPARVDRPFGVLQTPDMLSDTAADWPAVAHLIMLVDALAFWEQANHRSDAYTVCCCRETLLLLCLAFACNS